MIIAAEMAGYLKALRTIPLVTAEQSMEIVGKAGRSASSVRRALERGR